MKTKPNPERRFTKLITVSGAAALAISSSALLMTHRNNSGEGYSRTGPTPSLDNHLGIKPSSSLSAEEQLATAMAQPCDGTVLTHLDLSRPPTEAELIASGNLGKKLTPTGPANPADMADPAARKHQELDNLAFGEAIQTWNEHRYAESVNLFEQHLKSFPGSPWAAESMLHIGCYCQYNSRFNESAEWFDKANAASSESAEMLQKSKLRRAMANILLGRLDDATAALGDFLRINTSPQDATYASYWLREISVLKNNEAAFRDCGKNPSHGSLRKWA